MNFNDFTVSAYFKDVNRFPILTQEEEKDLVAKAKNGSKAAKDKLVNSNLRFVITVAKNYQGKGMELADLISEGNIGLISALDHFDASKNCRFLSYAVWWIRQSITKALSEKSREIRLPSNKVNELMQIEKAKEFVSKDKSSDEQIFELSDMTDLSPEYIRDIMNMGKESVSLDSPVGTDSDSATLGELCSDTASLTPEENAMKVALNEDINNALKTLKPSAEKVLRLRYGLDGEKPMSLQEIGKICGVTKERVRQIEKSAIGLLKMPSRRLKLEAYVA